MEDNSIEISFTHEGVHYLGWATPSGKLNEEGTPKSWHVVLNKVFYGNLSRNNNIWVNDEDRPESLTEAVGRYLSTVQANNENELPVS